MIETLLYVCSSNPGKLREFRAAALPEELLQNRLRIEALPLLEQIPAPAETGASFLENASLKARFYSGFTSELVFADDSGLAVEALGGAPGVLSARFAGEDATDEANNDLLLRRMAEITERTAFFECVIALARARQVLRTFKGSVRGQILREPSLGAHGFGYDPLFFYPPFHKSFAELETQEKWKVSHRGEAFRQMLNHLSQQNISVMGADNSVDY
ncbi:MAG TPA: RdgB/HAM1 family non-canonical purine NTP pyrophosphatase [Bryobacteraceae bacterium]|nr:RdgB/HAM1 family non-canonical purine NTP pyrophosphatase [Bryobacteraceae bacterium]